MECTLAAVSDFAYADRATGKLYILGVVRYIWSSTVPARHDRLAVTFMLEEFTTNVAGASVEVRLHVQNSDGLDVVPPSPVIPLPFSPVGPAAVGRSASQFSAELNDLVLPQYGDYAVLLRRPSGEVIARAPFTVTSPPNVEPRT